MERTDVSKRNKGEIEELLTTPRPDRRTLSHVPDPEHIRSSSDRRGQHLNPDTAILDPHDAEHMRQLSIRYVVNFDVHVRRKRMRKKAAIIAKAVDISSTGLLVQLDDTSVHFIPGMVCQLQFDIPPGSMPEGYEAAINITATVVRAFTKQEDGQDLHMVAFQFQKPLTAYLQRKRWGYSVFMASGLLFVAVALIMLMRVDSIIYFKYNRMLYLYSIVAAVFLLTRYLFGAMYRDVPINPNYTPGVSIIIPCFNEEQWIHRTILSCINQDYPIHKLEVIVVDDCSTDRSVEEINKMIDIVHKEAERFDTISRLKLIALEENAGKRVALVTGVEQAKHDLVVFVDSDSFLEPSAIKHLVQPFQDPKMGGVAGRTDVENKYTNSVTKLQTVRYYIAFRIMKAAEALFDSVTCLSGPLSCYRKQLVQKHADAWVNQTFLGQPATFGDDRSLTNSILRTHRTSYQDTAICSTIVPSQVNVFLKQQMRWKRSWLRESFRAATFIWRKEPFMALFFYIGILVPIAAPIIVLNNLIYVPIVHRIFPGTFLMGLMLMALLMSLAHLMLRKSKLWLFGFVFVAFYELVLLWQMPVAWVTFWKSTWGTRETPQDVEAKNRRKMRRTRRNKRKQRRRSR